MMGRLCLRHGISNNASTCGCQIPCVCICAAELINGSDDQASSANGSVKGSKVSANHQWSAEKREKRQRLAIAFAKRPAVPVCGKCQTGS